MFGFLNVYKPKGITSHDVIGILRRITKIKQIGHTGTLDPFAEGVLPVCIGKATRLIEYLKDDKAYIGTIQLGKSTNTYDIEGDVVNISDKTVTKEEIEQALENFKGEILQLPPIYSAIKINGKKLYELARKGEKVEVEPRKVNISELKIINYNKELKQLELFIACSKGTYIRSIANDLGEKLRTYGHLIKLKRVKAGGFEIKDSIMLEDLKIEDIKQHIIYPLEKLDYPQYSTTADEYNNISHGMPLIIQKDLPNGVILLTHKNELIAVGEKVEKTIKCQKVFI